MEKNGTAILPRTTADDLDMSVLPENLSGKIAFSSAKKPLAKPVESKPIEPTHNNS